MFSIFVIHAHVMHTYPHLHHIYKKPWCVSLEKTSSLFYAARGWTGVGRTHLRPTSQMYYRYTPPSAPALKMGPQVRMQNSREFVWQIMLPTLIQSARNLLALPLSSPHRFLCCYKLSNLSGVTGMSEKRVKLFQSVEFYIFSFFPFLWGTVLCLFTGARTL